MPRNGSGSYDLPITFIADTPATASDMNTEFGDVATALTQSLCTDGQSIMSGAIKGYAGSVGTPGYGFSSGTTSGLYLASAGQVGMATLGAVSMLWNSDQSVTFSSTANLNLPNGTTAQRPGSPAAGMFRYNSTLTQVEYYNGSLWAQPVTSAASTAASAGALFGCIMSTSAGDATNDIDVTAGIARDSTNVYDINESALTGKQLDSSWAAGSNAGMRSSAGLANGTWFIFAIGKTDGSAADIFAHTGLDPTSVLPSGYGIFRRIGCLLREGGSNVAFVQNGDYFQRKTLASDLASNNPGTSAVSVTLSVPVGLKVMSDLLFTVVNSSSGDTYGLVSDLDCTDETPTATKSHVGDVINSTGGVIYGHAPVQIWTNTSGQVRVRISNSSANISTNIYTRGWYDLRGKMA